MSAARRASFAAGRAAARRALRSAGHRRVAIGIDADGVPLFPDGYAGSISHKHERAVAVAMSTRGTLGVGVDLEFQDHLDDADLRDGVASDSELSSLEGLAEAEPSLASPATLLLSAKEALYKAIFPLRRIAFDFEDIELSFAPGRRSFAALRFPGDAALQAHGHYILVERWILCLATVEALLPFDNRTAGA